MILPVTKNPPFEDLESIFNFLKDLRYPDSNSHTKIGNKLVTIANTHFKRADGLCKIEEVNGKPNPEQLVLLNKVFTVFNDE